MTNIGRPTDGQNQWYPFMDRPVPSMVDGVLQNPPVVPVRDVDPLPPSLPLSVDPLVDALLSLPDPDRCLSCFVLDVALKTI